MRPSAALGAALVVAALISSAALIAACEGGDGDCVSNLPSSCQPLYQPSFTEIHKRTFIRSCAQAGTACHASAGIAGGLDLENLSLAHDQLLGNTPARARVLPNDAACSILVKRLESDDPSFVMPPGRKLSEAERCVIRQWIAAGAKK